MNHVIFTQDIPGERDWLSSIFPGAVNLQTIDSGRWPTSIPSDLDGNYIWEMAPDNQFDVEACPGEKYKSLYQLDFDVPTDRWTDSDHLLGDIDQFATNNRASHALVLTVGRCGTEFLESVLKKACGYRQLVNWTQKQATLIWPNKHELLLVSHSFPHTPIHKVGADAWAVAKQYQPDIFFVYRKNWWAWMSSVLIHNKLGHFHYDDVVDFDAMKPFKGTTQDVDHVARQAKSAFNNLCHMRAHFPALNFHIFEFSELIKNKALTDHQQIKYDKKRLITNYDELEEYCITTYQNQLDNWERRFISHTKTMKCQHQTNFDWAVVNQNV